MVPNTIEEEIICEVALECVMLQLMLLFEPGLYCCVLMSECAADDNPVGCLSCIELC